MCVCVCVCVCVCARAPTNTVLNKSFCLLQTNEISFNDHLGRFHCIFTDETLAILESFLYQIIIFLVRVMNELSKQMTY